jgi:uncharacterized protein YndB with AHSA1/START domain
MTHATATASDREIVQERVFDAPRALVFKAWTDPQHLPSWFGPKGFTCTTHAIDVREGGSWHFDMHAPDGKAWPNFMRFLEVVPNERLVYDHGAEPDGAPHFRVEVTFADEGVRTRLVQRSTFPTAEACEAVKGFGAVELGGQTLDKLAARVATMGLRFTRTFDAPLDLVYKAWVEPERFAKWWGPAGFDLDVKTVDVRPGGVFHYRMHNAQGEMWGKFRYVEIVAPERIVWINSFSDPEGNTTRAPFSAEFPLEIYNVVTFTERDGKTVMEMGGGPLDASPAELAFYQGMNASMQGGFGKTFDQLDAYLAGAR